jgi:hypothetical protein
VASRDNAAHDLMNARSADRLEQLILRGESDDNVGAVVVTGSHPERSSPCGRRRAP